MFVKFSNDFLSVVAHIITCTLFTPCGITVTGTNHKGGMMPNTVLNKLSKIDARVLYAGATCEHFTAEEVRTLVESMNHKSYPIHDVNRSIEHLISLRFLRATFGPNDAPNYFRVTKAGRGASNLMRRLGEEQPDPYRMYTRPSYSPNVKTATV